MVKDCLEGRKKKERAYADGQNINTKLTLPLKRERPKTDDVTPKPAHAAYFLMSWFSLAQVRGEAKLMIVFLDAVE